MWSFIKRNSDCILDDDMRNLVKKTIEDDEILKKRKKRIEKEFEDGMAKGAVLFDKKHEPKDIDSI